MTLIVLVGNFKTATIRVRRDESLKQKMNH